MANHSYSCPEIPMDRGAWQAIVHGITRVGHNLVTKPQPILFCVSMIHSFVLWVGYHFENITLLIYSLFY